MKQSKILFAITVLLLGGYLISGCSSTTTSSSLSKLSISLESNDINADTGVIGMTITATDSGGNGMSGLAPVVTLDPKALGYATTPIDVGNGTYICSLNGLRTAGSFSVSTSIGAKTTKADFKVGAGALNTNTSTLNVFPTTVAADGKSSADLTITLYDSFNNPIPITSGYFVTYTTTGINQTIPAAQFSAINSAPGIFKGTITSTTVGPLYVSGYITNSSLSYISQKQLMFFTIPTLSMSITAPTVLYINEPGINKPCINQPCFNIYVDVDALDSGNPVSGLNITSYVSLGLNPASSYTVTGYNTPEIPPGSGTYTNTFTATNIDIEKVRLKAISTQTSANAVTDVTFLPYTSAQPCSATASISYITMLGDGLTITANLTDYNSSQLTGYDSGNTFITMTTSGAYLTTSSSSSYASMITTTSYNYDGCSWGYSATFDSSASGAGPFTIDTWANGIFLTSTTITVQ